MKNIKYTTLFDYAVKHWSLSWNDCHKTFFKTNAIPFNGKSHIFYLEDLVAEIDLEIFPMPLWSSDYRKAITIIRWFMDEIGVYELKFYS